MTDTTTDNTAKIKRLAEASLFFRNGVAELVEEGADPDELNEMIEAAEEGVRKDQEVARKDQDKRRQQFARRQAVKKI